MAFFSVAVVVYKRIIFLVYLFLGEREIKLQTIPVTKNFARVSRTESGLSIDRCTYKKMEMCGKYKRIILYKYHILVANANRWNFSNLLIFFRLSYFTLFVFHRNRQSHADALLFYLLKCASILNCFFCNKKNFLNKLLFFLLDFSVLFVRSLFASKTTVCSLT